MKATDWIRHFNTSPDRGPAPASARPWWMTALSLVCLAALLINVPRDLFFAETRGVEVWLGFEVTGWAAIMTAPVHWAIFGIGAWAFWTARPWVVPWAAAYFFYVALSHLVWSEASANGRGLPIGLAQAAGFSALGFLLLRENASLRRTV
jgi:hypothetical protein